MKRLLYTILIFCAVGLQMYADNVRWGNTPNDSVEINKILQSLSKLDDPKPTDAARFFIGRPYVAATLEGDPEMLTVRTDVFDCTTFVETCLALAQAAKMPDADVAGFVEALTNLRYRDGVIDGYPSRLHYISDWITNAEDLGLTEVTTELPGCDYVVKSLNFMSTHPQSYPALKNNPETVAAIKRFEAPYQNFKMPYVPASRVNNSMLNELKDGDIIAITTGIPGLDVTHMGLITVKNGVRHLTHASSSAKRVVTTTGSLADYFKTHRKATGIRVFRQSR